MHRYAAVSPRRCEDCFRLRRGFGGQVVASLPCASASRFIAGNDGWIQFRDLATCFARALHLFALSFRGRGEDRVLAAPEVSCAVAHSKRCTRAYRYSGASRPSLRNGFTAYFVLFPENGCFASVAGETDPANLTPAPRRPNHTTSPYASGAHVCRAISVHRISPRVRDVRERPSSAVRRAKLCG
ncbi:hypothetical protein V1283_002864 [Bradyrhizobium sp. AZCC 2262]